VTNEQDRLAYALATLRRAAEHGYPWSIYPAEALALVAEVERLRAELDATEKERDQWIDAAMYRRQALHDADSLMTGVRLALSPDGGVNGWRPSRGVDALIDLSLEVREERDRLRSDRAWLVEEVLSQTGATADELAACMAAPGHMPVVNHRMGEAIRERISDRAAVVAWLRTRERQIENWPPGGANEISLTYRIIADAIERGEHRCEEDK
jgi:hypothetical protein